MVPATAGFARTADSPRSAPGGEGPSGSSPARAAQAGRHSEQLIRPERSAGRRAPRPAPARSQSVLRGEVELVVRLPRVPVTDVPDPDVAADVGVDASPAEHRHGEVAGTLVEGDEAPGVDLSAGQEEARRAVSSEGRAGDPRERAQTLAVTDA